MKSALLVLVVLGGVGCAATVPPDPQAEAKAFYAKQNELRAQNQAERQRVSEEQAKEKKTRLDAEAAERAAAYDARLTQAKEDAAARSTARELAYTQQTAQADAARKDRYTAKKEARERKEAEEEAAVQAEIVQCRNDPKCTWERVSAPLCEAIKNKRLYQQDMAKEQANPSGFVNKVFLHDLGAEIQLCDENIAMFRKDYREQMHRAFNESTCQK